MSFVFLCHRGKTSRGLDERPRLQSFGHLENRNRTVLLTNATCYTRPNGQITIAAEAQSESVRFAITDTGIGIGAEDRAKLFTPFFRSEHPAVREHKGWGLALHLVKRLVEMLGGAVGVESELGKGSVLVHAADCREIIHHRDTENTENKNLCALRVSVVKE